MLAATPNHAVWPGIITGSAKAVFSLADTDNDGRLTEKEAAIAMNAAARQLGVSRGRPSR